jgi:hypothetical protein
MQHTHKTSPRKQALLTSAQHMHACSSLTIAEARPTDAKGGPAGWISKQLFNWQRITKTCRAGWHTPLALAA